MVEIDGREVAPAKAAEGGGGSGLTVAEKAMASPLYLHPSDGPSNLITTLQLKGENYEDWAKHVRNALRTKRKLGFIDGTVEKPTKDDDSLAKKSWIARVVASN